MGGRRWHGAHGREGYMSALFIIERDKPAGTKDNNIHCFMNRPGGGVGGEMLLYMVTTTPPQWTKGVCSIDG